jgi:septum formation protein
MSPINIILASGSPYRNQQLQSLGVPFIAISPEVDEAPLNDESPRALVARLSLAKARKIHAENNNSCVIGSDQVCSYAGKVYGKPGNANQASKQLHMFSNNSIEFLTALTVINPSGAVMSHTDRTVVQFRALTDVDISRYIETERPFDCAGSFKVESLGLSLFQSVESTDPSALMGLPLIKLCEFLRQAGHQIP